jgi:cytoskeletal protein CcmA (bactofilin family)
VVKAGELRACDVVPEGRIEGGRVEAVHRLELRAGAVFQEKDILAQDLLVASGVSVEFQRDFRCRDLDIRGAVSGSIRAAGRVTIHAAGLMKGRLQARQLVVEEGGGLVGDFAVRAEESA